ncbi:MAG: ATP-dependent DNA ligase [Microbacterium sp.]|uniref:ATP-dependent DNA ligase n=1 Tax=unclassified Microbacterium TaxID=2609290 RepID=UPI000DB1A3A0|nr:ATP-dependent DNA ligase [Microbacterium sp.]PZU40181.1 MAG: ATP-dependent DNA ligase [Microbacterium sp.]
MPHEIPAPMLAKAVPEVPDRTGLSFEPKWDGFRVLVSWDGESVELGSRGAKPLTRYFPELVEALPHLLPRPALIDGEIVVAIGEPGAQRLDWEALSQRIHPAASRVQRLAAETPAMIIAFDLLVDGDEDVAALPFAERRARLESLLAGVQHPLHLTRTTTDAALARHWLAEFEGAGLDGVVAKPIDQPYAPGKRTMLKIKHARTADVVAIGYRVHKSGQGVGSLLVGLYDDGVLRGVGGVAAWSDKRRLELVDELAPLVERDESGDAVTGEGDRSRFSGSKDVSFVRLRPERVLEVRYDQLEGRRFRHTVQFERWRPDRDAASCRFDQLEQVSAYDLGRVLY